MSTQKKKTKADSSVKVRDMKPRKEAKGGLLPAVGPAKSLNFSRAHK